MPDTTSLAGVDALLDDLELCEAPHPDQPGLRCAIPKDGHPVDFHEALTGPDSRDAHTWPIPTATQLRED